MLIVYRTNAGFEGRIASVDRATTSDAMNAFLATEGGRDLAYIEIREDLADPALVSALDQGDPAYTVDPMTRVLLKDGTPVALGYDPEALAALVASVDGNQEILGLLAATDEQIAAYAAGKTVPELMVMLAHILRRMAIAVGFRPAAPR